MGVITTIFGDIPEEMLDRKSEVVDTEHSINTITEWTLRRDCEFGEAGKLVRRDGAVNRKRAIEAFTSVDLSKG